MDEGEVPASTGQIQDLLQTFTELCNTKVQALEGTDAAGGFKT
jgi:hypothetical protein